MWWRKRISEDLSTLAKTKKAQQINHKEIEKKKIKEKEKKNEMLFLECVVKKIDGEWLGYDLKNCL